MTLICPINLRKNIKSSPNINTKQWNETLFEDYGHKYDNECFTQGTLNNANLIKNFFILQVFCRLKNYLIFAVRLLSQCKSSTFPV